MPGVALDSSFWSRALATLIGTVAGFAFSIVLFYISEHVKRASNRKQILCGLGREASFNVARCDDWLKAFGAIRLKAAASDRAVFDHIDYTRTLTVFLQEAGRAGLLYQILSDQELVNLDKSVKFLQPFSERDINDKINQWKTGALPAADLSRALDFHEYVIKEVREAMATLRKKVEEAG